MSLIPTFGSRNSIYSGLSPQDTRSAGGPVRPSHTRGRARDTVASRPYGSRSFYRVTSANTFRRDAVIQLVQNISIGILRKELSKLTTTALCEQYRVSQQGLELLYRQKREYSQAWFQTRKSQGAPQTPKTCPSTGIPTPAHVYGGDFMQTSPDGAQPRQTGLTPAMGGMTVDSPNTAARFSSSVQSLLDAAIAMHTPVRGSQPMSMTPDQAAHAGTQVTIEDLDELRESGSGVREAFAAPSVGSSSPGCSDRTADVSDLSDHESTDGTHSEASTTKKSDITDDSALGKSVSGSESTDENDEINSPKKSRSKKRRSLGRTTDVTVTPGGTVRIHTRSATRSPK